MIHTGDCIEVMRTMPASSVDAVVTDPPYGLEFMGKEWDRLGATIEPTTDTVWPDRPAGASLPFGGGGQRVRYGVSAKSMQSWHEQWAREAFRVLKPGGYLLAFGGTRTVHRLASAIEDAGFEIRDELVWIYASGFPKSLDVGKAMDRAAGADRQDVLEDKPGVTDNLAYGSGLGVGIIERRPVSDLAKQWDGWGTALKPAHEPIVMARKPLIGTVAANVTRYGTGALNIDGTRIGTEERYNAPAANADGTVPYGPPTNLDHPGTTVNGRWPSNILLSDPELFDQPNPYVVGSGATAETPRVIRATAEERGMFSPGTRPVGEVAGYGDTGGYSRFFKLSTDHEHDWAPAEEVWEHEVDDLYLQACRICKAPRDPEPDYPKAFLIPKADRADREPTLRGQLEERQVVASVHGGMGDAKNPNHPRANSHPTVKPTDLMRHLVRLVTPLGGTVLDCFLGSGSTAIACELEGFPWIGIEREPEYVAIAEARLNGVQRGLGLDVPAPTKAPPKTHPDLSKHQPKRRAPAENWSGGWIGSSTEAGVSQDVEQGDSLQLHRHLFPVDTGTCECGMTSDEFYDGSAA